MRFQKGHVANPNGAAKKALPDNGLQTLTQLAARGVRDNDLARAMQFSVPLFKRYLIDHPEAQEAIDAGRQLFHDTLVDGLVKAAANGREVPAMFLLKTRFGYRENDQPSDTRPVVTINLPGAMTPEQYAKGLTIEHEGDKDE